MKWNYFLKHRNDNFHYFRRRNFRGQKLSRMRASAKFFYFADINFRGWLGLIFFADINFRGRPISNYFACINFRGSTINWKNFPNSWSYRIRLIRYFVILSTYFVKKIFERASCEIIFSSKDKKFRGWQILKTFADKNFRGWPDLIFFADINFRGRAFLIFFAEETFADLG